MHRTLAAGEHRQRPIADLPSRGRTDSETPTAPIARAAFAHGTRHRDPARSRRHPARPRRRRRFAPRRSDTPRARDDRCRRAPPGSGRRDRAGRRSAMPPGCFGPRRRRRVCAAWPGRAPARRSTRPRRRR
jgi:hypothetical protein